MLRGRAIIREVEQEPRSRLWRPAAGVREVRTHRGIVLAVGDGTYYGKHVIPMPVRVGDVVQYHWESHEESATIVWPEDGKRAVIVPQWCVDAVIELEAEDELPRPIETHDRVSVRRDTEWALS